MKVFISYSFNPNDRYLVSLLVSDLRRNNFSIATKATVPFLGDVGSSIQTSDLFIGIVTKDAAQTSDTIKEWKLARKYKITNLLLVEKGMKMVNMPPDTHIIVFDKNNPQKAINNLRSFKQNTFRRIPAPKSTIKQKPIKTGTPTTNTLSNDSALGVAAFSLAVLVALMAANKKTSR